MIRPLLPRFVATAIGVALLSAPIAWANAQSAARPAGATARPRELRVDSRAERARDAVRRVGQPTNEPHMGVLGHTLIGAAIGLGAGAVAGYVVTHTNPRVTDHSEDGLIYIPCILLGTATGTVVGFVIGVARTR